MNNPNDKLLERKNLNSMSDQIEDHEKGLKKVSQILNITHVLLVIGVILAGTALAYINAITINREDFDIHKEEASKRTEDLIEKQGQKLGVELRNAVSPLVTEMTSMKNKLDENMEQFSSRLNVVEKDLEATSTALNNGQVVRGTDFFNYQRDSLQEVQGIKNELLRIQLDVKNLESLKSELNGYVTVQQQEDHDKAYMLRLDSLVESDNTLSEQIDTTQKELESSIENVEKKIIRIEDTIFRRK